MEDSQIVSLYWERKEEAIQETARKYGTYCYKIAYNILYNKEDAKESVNDTDMNACFSEEDLETVIADIPADRIGKPEEVADLCLQLVQAPEYLTGQIIALDGGWI